jgi:DNA oxidative demethylase
VQLSLDTGDEQVFSRPKVLSAGVVLLRGFAQPVVAELHASILQIAAASPFRHLVTPGGHTMSVAMTNCGSTGWVSDRRGYRYDALDPSSGKPWPAMPSSFQKLALEAASAAGFEGFVPNACLVNRYTAGTKLSLHQDRDENNYDQPIVSVSLGIPAIFLLGGLERSDRTQRLPLFHADVLVWGGPARMIYHGVMPLKAASHSFMDNVRINLTFRSARPVQH